MFNVINLLEQLKPEDKMRNVRICEWLRDEMQNRSGIELSHYLNDFVYDVVNPGFVLTLKFPLPADFFDSFFGDVEINGSKGRNSM